MAGMLLKLSGLERPFDGLIGMGFFRIVLPVRAASLCSVFLGDAATPLRSLLAEPRVKADVFVAADVRAEAPFAPRDLGRAFIDLCRALFADPFHILTIALQ